MSKKLQIFIYGGGKKHFKFNNILLGLFFTTFEGYALSNILTPDQGSR
jgi:multisubunit Na+/H+ antiporter MnhE subunit